MLYFNQKPIEKLLKDLRGFLPDDSIKGMFLFNLFFKIYFKMAISSEKHDCVNLVLCSDALSNNGVLVDYLHLLKDMKAQMNNVQSFLEAHIRLLEDIKAQPQQKHDTG